MRVVNKIAALFSVSVIAGQAALAPAFAIEQSEQAAPEFKKYEIAQGIEPTPNGLAKEMSDQAEVIAEQERRLSGVQKQVTVLHAKKADKEEVQALADHSASVGRGLVETRDQVARITAMLRDRNQKLEERVDIAEKKITHLVNIIKLQKENRK